MTEEEYLEKTKVEIACSDRKTCAIWAADCAERVLPHFEQQYPQDARPRKAIEAGRAWARGEIKITEARAAAFAAHAAARQAGYESARNAARAVHTAIYAAAVVGYAAGSAAAAGERDWHYRYLRSLREADT